MDWTIEYGHDAIRDLNKVDRSIRLEIFRYMQGRIAQADNRRHFGKALRHKKFDLWRCRIRDFRIICEFQDARRVMLVIGVGHRKNGYR